LIFELNSKVLEFENKMLKLKPMSSKIKRTRVKSHPKSLKAIYV
jgi:hypothetical protein